MIVDSYVLIQMKTNQDLFDLFQEEMRDTNESTNSRVLYFSIFSMCCLLGLATWQVREIIVWICLKEFALFSFTGAVSEEVF